jgi:hypothetical protein
MAIFRIIQTCGTRLNFTASRTSFVPRYSYLLSFYIILCFLVLSDRALCHLILCCLALCCLVFSWVVVCCVIFSCLVLSCLVLSCLVLPCGCGVVVLSCGCLVFTCPAISSLAHNRIPHQGHTVARTCALQIRASELHRKKQIKLSPSP